MKGRSTATIAQEKRAVEMLRTGPKTSDQLRAAGLMQAPSRIFGLREQGFVIDTELIDGYDRDGYFHKRMGRYTLVSEPLNLTDKTAALMGGSEGATC